MRGHSVGEESTSTGRYRWNQVITFEFGNVLNLLLSALWDQRTNAHGWWAVGNPQRSCRRHQWMSVFKWIMTCGMKHSEGSSWLMQSIFHLALLMRDNCRERSAPAAVKYYYLMYSEWVVNCESSNFLFSFFFFFTPFFRANHMQSTRIKE